MKQKLKLWVKENIPSKFIELFTSQGIMITKIPKEKEANISDLFPYKIENNWNTYFELLNVPHMLSPEAKSETPYTIELKFYDINGKFLSNHQVLSSNNLRETLDIGKITKQLNIITDGIFAVFHQKHTTWLTEQNSFMAERGYIGFENKNIGPIKSYIHGNLDAIAQYEDKEYLLANWSWKTKEYHLQHDLLADYSYELFLVNASTQTQLIEIIEETREGRKSTILKIPQRGIKNYLRASNKEGLNAKIIVKSKLYLARPIVFKYMDTSFDVFHG